jgi:hypothetical protein
VASVKQNLILNTTETFGNLQSTSRVRGSMEEKLPRATISLLMGGQGLMTVRVGDEEF